MTTPSTPARLCAFAIIGLLAFTSGCETGANRAGYGVNATQFQDMVVPAGLRLRERGHESYSRQEAGWRMGNFVYEGTTGVEEAMGYVRQRMPQHNWTIVSEDLTADEMARLRFERGIYTAEYTFQRRDGSTQMVVVYNTDYSRR
jgi:hypothetical protein